MQITDWILAQLQSGQQPDAVAKELVEHRLSMPQWDALIQSAKEMGANADVQPFLLTLFHAARVENDWLYLRILGIIAQNPAFDMRERQNTLTSMEKRLNRLEKLQQTNPDAETEEQLSEYNAYLLVLKGSLHVERGETAQARLLYQEAREIYDDLGNASFVTWLDSQLKKLAPTPQPAQPQPDQSQPAIKTAAEQPIRTTYTPRPQTNPTHAPYQRPAILPTAHPQPVEKVETQPATLKLQADLDASRSEQALLQKENARLRSEMQTLNTELKELREAEEAPDVRDRSVEDDLRQEVENKITEIEDLRESLRKKDQQVINLQRDVQARHDQIGQLRQQLQLKQDEIKKLNQKLDELNG